MSWVKVGVGMCRGVRVGGAGREINKRIPPVGMLPQDCLYLSQPRQVA